MSAKTHNRIVKGFMWAIWFVSFCNILIYGICMGMLGVDYPVWIHWVMPFDFIIFMLSGDLAVVDTD